MMTWRRTILLSYVFLFGFCIPECLGLLSRPSFHSSPHRVVYHTPYTSRDTRSGGCIKFRRSLSSLYMCEGSKSEDVKEEEKEVDSSVNKKDDASSSGGGSSGGSSFKDMFAADDRKAPVIISPVSSKMKNKVIPKSALSDVPTGE